MTLYTAHHANNDEVFPLILAQYLPDGGAVADPTYGHGIFWRRVNLEKWRLFKTDLIEGVDLRKTPYPPASMDGWVIDPPYMHDPGRKPSNMPRDFYRNKRVEGQRLGIAELVELYRDGFLEARRCLKPKGLLITKCQDQVSGGKQHLVHVSLLNILYSQDYICEDIFIVIPRRKPFMDPRWGQQKHARKNHSYFLVHRWRGKLTLPGRYL